MNLTNGWGAMMSNELPETPKGWTRKMVFHLNYGDAGGAATFEVFDSNGDITPIGYQYDTRKGGLTGFTLPGCDGVLSWVELRARWPEWLAAQ